jgi:hypothetical protein
VRDAIAGPALALAALAATLLAAELGARLLAAPPRYHGQPLELDPELGFRGIPHHAAFVRDERGLFELRLNADGLRGPAIAPRPPGDRTLRVAFLGDSFLFGAGVRDEELLTSRVAALLGERGLASEVFNLSAADYGTGQELLLLRRFGEALAPDVVVLGAYPQNDLINDYEGLSGLTRLSPGDVVRPYLVPEAGQLRIRHARPAAAFLRRHSRLYAVLERRVIGAAEARGIRWLLPAVAAEDPAARLRRGEAPLEQQEIFRSHPDDHRWERAWQRSFQLLDAFREACRQLGARPIVLVIPDLHQVARAARDVELDLLAREIAATPLDAWLDWDLPERRMSEHLAARGVEALILLPQFRSAARAGATLYLRDAHLAPAGHELAARQVAAAIAGDAPEPALPGAAGPVPLPVGPAAPRAIEPGRADHARYLGPAQWSPWAPSAGAAIEGAVPVARALVALPARGSELVVKGLATPRGQPLEVAIEVAGGPRLGFQIDRPGPYEARVALPAARLPRAGGHVALRIGPAHTDADPGRLLIVSEIGFAGRPARAAPRRRRSPGGRGRAARSA